MIAPTHSAMPLSINVCTGGMNQYCSPKKANVAASIEGLVPHNQAEKTIAGNITRYGTFAPRMGFKARRMRNITITASSEINSRVSDRFLRNDSNLVMKIRFLEFLGPR